VHLKSKHHREIGLLQHPEHTSGWKQPREFAAAADPDVCQIKMLRSKKETSSGNLLPIISMV
jgi:hypothetical protein